jgi:hypothetical protein
VLDARHYARTWTRQRCDPQQGLALSLLTTVLEHRHTGRHRLKVPPSVLKNRCFWRYARHETHFELGLVSAGPAVVAHLYFSVVTSFTTGTDCSNTVLGLLNYRWCGGAGALTLHR